MKSILILMLCVALFGCSGSETPLEPLAGERDDFDKLDDYISIVEDVPTPDDAKEPVVDVDEGELRGVYVPYEVRRYFEHLQTDLSEAEFEDTMWQIYRYLMLIITYDTLQTHLRETLPKPLYEDVLDIVRDRTRGIYLTDSQRVVIAVVLANPNRKLYDVKLTVFPFWPKDGEPPPRHRLLLSWVPTKDIQWIHYFNGNPKDWIAAGDFNAEHIIELDDDGHPKDPYYRAWVIDFRDAPRATDEQVYEYQQQYGCLSNRNLWFTNRCHQNPGQPMNTSKKLHDDGSSYLQLWGDD